MRRIFLAALLALAGCHDGTRPPVGADMSFVPAFAAHDKVDILFMIDSSNTAPIQTELQHRFPGLVKHCRMRPRAIRRRITSEW